MRGLGVINLTLVHWPQRRRAYCKLVCMLFNTADTGLTPSENHQLQRLEKNRAARTGTPEVNQSCLYTAFGNVRDSRTVMSSGDTRNCMTDDQLRDDSES